MTDPDKPAVDYTEIYQGAVNQLRKDLEAKMEAFDVKLQERLEKITKDQEYITQHLDDAAAQFKYMKDSYDEQHDLVVWLRKRLASLLPEPNNCSKCGTKLIKASKKCPCGHQN